VDDDPDAVRWDPELGWLVDVTIYGGPLDQMGPVTCRVGVALGRAGELDSAPVAPGTEVLVAIVDGDADANPVILAQLHNNRAPVSSTVNGTDIDEAKAAADLVRVFGGGEDTQLGGTRRVAAPVQQILADDLRLAEQEASQPFVRGNDYGDAFDALLDALDTFAGALAGAPPAPPNAALTVASVLAAYADPVTGGGLKVAIARAKAARSDYLSTKIRGE
jgi:hypothetical protein